ncbi:MAG TPA: PP2C family protein-serine/threonine phosphatase [Acidimicrobiales bacterium]|nr:PP2C family protein-serine/threonine phosphatase [Acidimicrobiales bacterium]
MTATGPDRAAQAIRVLEEAYGPAIPTAVAQAKDLLGASGAVLYLVDYRLSRLYPLAAPGQEPGQAVTVEGTPEGRVFASQQVILSAAAGEVIGRAAVSIHGERLGVLELRYPDPAPPQLESWLAVLSVAAARSLRVSLRSTDLFERTVRSQRLSLAAEMQWQLLPGRGCRADDFELAGQLEPAYHVAGDNFDWSVDPAELWVSISDGAGSGVAAAQVAALAMTAVRNARRGGLGLADQARMADEALFGLHRGEAPVQALLVRLDRVTGAVSAVGTGAARLLIQRGMQVWTAELEDQLPLGALEGTVYREQPVPVRPGDRLVMVSDGLHGAQPAGRSAFGEARLEQALRSLQLVPPAETLRQLIAELISHHDGDDLHDDAVAVVIDWHPH